MENTVFKYLDHVTEYHDIEFACKILEEYVLTTIRKINLISSIDNNNYLNMQNISNDTLSTTKIKVKDNFIHALGNLTFLYSKKEINKKRAENFIDEVFFIIPFENNYVIKHLSNFLEHIMIYNSKLIHYYLNKINNQYIENKDNGAILYKAVILSSVKNNIDLNSILPLIKYPWRSYFELSSYHLYYNNHEDALNYINKAIKSCPSILKSEYRKRQEYIIKFY